jgi:hypothetical protein
MNILEILKSKPHNPHYLNRYYNFIISCTKNNANLGESVYTEMHHICPKANDLFPEYKSLKKFPWNKSMLTDRQHYIAHWLLWKSYTNASQTHAFMCMSDNQNTKSQKRGKKILNSKTYKILKENSRNYLKKISKGKSIYIDSNGNKVRCNTDDQRVLSGELVSTTLGRKHTWKERTAEQIKARNDNCTDAAWKRHPVRKISLYFLDLKITVEYTKGMPEILPYLDHGWGFRATKEYLLKAHNNRKVTEESRIRCGRKIAETMKRKKELGLYKPRKRTKESRKLRRKMDRSYDVLCYDTIENNFVEVDILDIAYNHIKCFIRASGSRVIFDENDNKRLYNILLKEVPPGYYECKSTDESLVFDLETRLVTTVRTRSITKNQIVVHVPNDKDRIKFYDELRCTNVYWHKNLKDVYGIPINYSTHLKSIR